MKSRKRKRPRPVAAGIDAPASGQPPLAGEHTRAPEGRAGGLQWWLAVLALCALTLLAYSNSFRVGFALDNQGLLQDPRIRAATRDNLALIFQHTYWWPTGEAGLYRPFTTLSYLFNYAILGDGEQAAGYHRVNLALHLVNVLLVFAMGRKLLGLLAPSALLAALWAVHPASTESVTNIVGRSDLLAAMATLSGLLMYARSTAAAGAGRIAWLAGLGVATAAGALSKESAVTVVGVIGLYELARPGRRPLSNLLPGLAAAGIPVATMLLLRASVLAASPPAEFPFTDNPIASAGFWTGRLTALKVAGFYLAQAVWPWRLSVDYAYSQITPGLGSAADWISASAALLAAAGVAALWRGQRTAFFLAGFALVVFLPTSNLLFPIGTIRADRFLYLPAAGVMGCLVIALYGWGRRARSPLAAPVVLLLLIGGFAVRTWVRNAEWHDELTLASADLRTSPQSFKLHRLAATLLAAADPSHANIDRIVEEIDRSVAILDPLPDLRNAPETYQVAGAAYLTKGDRLQVTDAAGAETAYHRARELLSKCVRIYQAYDRQREERYGRPAGGAVARSEPDACLLLSAAYQRLGDMDGATGAARDAQRLAPRNPRIYARIADLLLERRRNEEAAVALMEGMLLTADPELRSYLVRLYASSADPANCTLLRNAGGAGINPQCRIVRDHVCAAAPDVVKTLMDHGEQQEAMQKKQMFFSEYNCAPDGLK